MCIHVYLHVFVTSIANKKNGKKKKKEENLGVKIIKCTTEMIKTMKIVLERKIVDDCSG